MTLGANQIAAYAADLLDTEDDINALQASKRDLYTTIREEHGKAEADALKRAVKLSRMDAGKRSAAEAIDTEAERMLAIIERAARAPRATRESAKSVPIPADEADTSEGGELRHAALSAPDEGIEPTGGENVATHDSRQLETATAASPGSGRGADPEALRSDVEPVALISDACQNALRLRPHCLAAMRNEITKCGGHGKVHCSTCLKAHADAEGISA